MGGVGDWIASFHHRREEYSDESISLGGNYAEHRTHGRKCMDQDDANVENSVSPSSAARPCRRLRKALSSDDDDGNRFIDEQSVLAKKQLPTVEAMAPTFPKECPLVSSLMGGGVSDTSTISSPCERTGERQTATKSSDSNTSLYDDEAAGQHQDPGIQAVMSCLELSSDLSEHLQKTFSRSLEERLIVQDNIGRGRVALSRSFTSAELTAAAAEDLKLLKEYQLVGVQWLLALHERNYYGILADEMGLGKTAQTITFLKILHERKELRSPSVVTCPATLVDNWLAEFKKWAPSIRTLKYHGSQKERRERVKEFELLLDSDTPVDVLVTSHQAVANSWDRAILFKKHSFSYLIVDEAHNLKNAESQLYRSMRKLCSGCRRLFLTGTPIQNEIVELQNLLLLLLPDKLSSQTMLQAIQTVETQLFQEFTTDVVEFLRQVFAPFILRRLKSEVMNDLPPKVSIVERCTMDGRQEKMYLQEIREADSELSRELCSLASENVIPPLSPKEQEQFVSSFSETSSLPKKTTINNKQYLQNLMFRLRRICNHPLLFKGYYSSDELQRVIHYFHTYVEGFRDQPYERVKAEINSWSDIEIHQAVSDIECMRSLRVPDSEFLESAKIRRMLEIVDEVYRCGQKALIFSQFTTYLDVIEETLRLHRPTIKFFRLDGSTAVAERQDLVTEFGNSTREQGITLFLLSTKAGGVGLNLTAATTVLLMDQDWNPHNDRQAEDRVHRLGQTGTVTVHRLCCRGTLEESILKCAERKLRLDEAFGGSSDLLTAAILKDCFTTGLAVLAKKPEFGKTTTTRAHVSKATFRTDERELSPEIILPSPSRRRRTDKKKSSASQVSRQSRKKTQDMCHNDAAQTQASVQQTRLVPTQQKLIVSLDSPRDDDETTSTVTDVKRASVSTRHVSSQSSRVKTTRQPLKPATVSSLSSERPTKKRSFRGNNATSGTGAAPAKKKKVA